MRGIAGQYCIDNILNAASAAANLERNFFLDRLMPWLPVPRYERHS